MGILTNLQVYAASWKVTNSQKFDADDLASIDSCTIVSSKYGMSACLYMRGGGQSYIPVSSNSVTVNVGDNVDPRDITVETLSRKGDNDILRAKIERVK